MTYATVNTAIVSNVAINDVLNNNVVLKDIEVPAPFIKAASLDELEQMRVEWEEGVYRTSNLALPSSTQNRASG